MAVKPTTQWYPKGGQGYVLAQSGVDIQDNSGNLLITNSGNNLVPNSSYVQGKYVTSWSAVAHG